MDLRGDDVGKRYTLKEVYLSLADHLLYDDQSRSLNEREQSPNYERRSPRTFVTDLLERN